MITGADILRGRTIIALFKCEDDDTVLKLETSDGNFQANAYGDCCSRSWFEDVNLVATLPASVVDVVDRAMPPALEDEWKTIVFYGHTIKLSTGYIDIEYRNESNGYYGGWMEIIAGTDKHKWTLIPAMEDA